MARRRLLPFPAQAAVVPSYVPDPYLGRGVGDVGRILQSIPVIGTFRDAYQSGPMRYVAELQPHAGGSPILVLVADLTVNGQGTVPLVIAAVRANTPGGLEGWYNEFHPLPAGCASTISPVDVELVRAGKAGMDYRLYDILPSTGFPIDPDRTDNDIIRHLKDSNQVPYMFPNTDDLLGFAQVDERAWMNIPQQARLDVVLQWYETQGKQAQAMPLVYLAMETTDREVRRRLGFTSRDASWSPTLRPIRRR